MRLLSIVLVFFFLFDLLAAGQEANDCELPSYISLIPLEYRRELRKIWSSGPKTPEYCSRQKKRTEKLIAELPWETRERVKNSMTTTTPSPSEKSFLTGLSPEHINEFNGIMSVRSMNSFERSKRLKEWAVDILDPEAMSHFEHFVSLLERRSDKFREKLRTLSPAAISVFNRLEILKEQRRSLMKGMNRDAKKELLELWKMKCGKEEEDLQEDERRMACYGEEETTISTTTMTTTIVNKEEKKKWRPFPHGIPQLLKDPKSLSRLIASIFSTTNE